MVTTDNIDSDKKITLLFVFPGDRGHFNFTLRLVNEILDSNKNLCIEYFTHEESVSWIPPTAKLGGTLGSFPYKLVKLYTSLASFGNSKFEGDKNVKENFAVKLKELDSSFDDMNVMQNVKQLKERLYDKDVIGVVCEHTWCSQVMSSLCEEAKVPFLSLCPTPLATHVFHETLKSYLQNLDIDNSNNNNNHSNTDTDNGDNDETNKKKLLEFSKNKTPTIDELKECAGIIGYKDNSYTPLWSGCNFTIVCGSPIRDVYEKYLTYDCGNGWVGPILPQIVNPLPDDIIKFISSPSYEVNDNDEEKMIETDNIRNVVYFSFGSHMLLEFFPKNIIKNIIEGLLESLVYFSLNTKEIKVRTKLIIVANEKTQDTINSICLSQENKKRMMLLNWSPQWDLLQNKSVVGFVTHCGLNSIHEGVASTVPMICCPMFDDQYGNANSVVENGIGVRISKTVSKIEICDAFRKIITAEVIAKAKDKQKLLLKENMNSIKKHILEWAK